MEKRRIITLGIAGLSFILTASIISTVAWYTGSSYLTIRNIKISLKEPTLQISATGVDGTFKSYLSKNELNQISQFAPVSSMFSNEWISRRAQKPVFKDGPIAGSNYVMNKPTDYVDSTEGFFCQEFYLRSDTDTYVTFDKEKTKFFPNETANNITASDYGFKNSMKNKYPDLNDEELTAQLLDNLNNVVKSMRYSVLVLDDDPDDAYDDYNYYIYDPNKTETDKPTLLGGILDISESGFYSTYNHKEILFGETSSRNIGQDAKDCIVYGEPLLNATDSFNISQRTCFNANNAAGDQKILFDESHDLVIKEEDACNFDNVETTLLIPLSANKAKKIVLSIYQEGWDLDNTNFIVHSKFYSNVQFMIAPVRPRI